MYSDHYIRNHNTGIEVSYAGLFRKVVENIFVFKMHCVLMYLEVYRYDKTVVYVVYVGMYFNA
jgi:hypothetical protein